MSNLGGIFAAHLDADGTALIDRSRPGEPAKLSYRELDRRCGALAGGLLAAGLERGDRFGILSHNRGEFLELVFAALRVGIVPVREQGVDVLACCAGATRTPKYLAGQPDGGSSMFVPEMEPDAVVREALAALGSRPSMTPGRVNRLAAFFMQHLLPRRVAITLMANATRGMKGD